MNTHYTTWKIKIFVNMLIDIYNKRSNDGMGEDGKEDGCGDG